MTAMGRAAKETLEKIVHAAKRMDGVGTSIAKPKTTVKRHGSETRGLDKPDDKPDMANKPNAHKPNEGGDGSGSKPDGTEKRKGVDRGDGRDDYGHFVGGDNKPWVDKETIGLDAVARRDNVEVVRDQVAARIEGHRLDGATREQVRYFDGLFKNADGTYTGIEVKSGNADRTPQQKIFDSLVAERPAVATLPDGTRITIVDVILEEVV